MDDGRLREPILLQASRSLMWMEGHIRLLHLHESYSVNWHFYSDHHRSCAPATRQGYKEQGICTTAACRAQFATAVGWCSAQCLLGSHLSWPCIVDAVEELQSACFCSPSTLVDGDLMSGILSDPCQFCFQHQSTFLWTKISPRLVSYAGHICWFYLLFLGCSHGCR